MKAIALSAIQQVSLHSRQQVVEQAIARPFFASPHDRRVASRAQRVADLIFDHLAPDTPAAQRERFLSSMAPFIVAGAAFVLHANVESQWRTTALWSAICALVVQVLWLQSSTPLYLGFSCENAILLADFFGEKITVPFQFCRSSEMFHRFLDLLYSETQDSDARKFVRLRLYELYLGGTSQLISLSNWSRCMPGICLEMGIILVAYDDSFAQCPYCQCKHDDNTGYDVICATCSSRFWRTTEPWVYTNWAGSSAGAAVLRRRHGTDFDTELSQMNAPLTSSLSVAQWYHSPSALPDSAVWRRCSRVHILKLLEASYASEHFQPGSKVLMDTLLCEETSSRSRGPEYELLRSYISILLDGGNPDDRDLDLMCALKSVYDDVRHSYWGIQEYDPWFRGPMTVEEQLLANMVSAVDAFIAEPSREGVRRWKELVKGHSPEFLSLDESQRVDELLADHENIGGYFDRFCEYLDSQ